MTRETTLLDQKTSFGEKNYHEFVKQANTHLNNWFWVLIKSLKHL